MAPRRSTKGNITVHDYVRLHQGVRLDDVVRNAIVRTKYRKKLPFTYQGIRLSDKRLVTVMWGNYWRIYTNDMDGLQAAIKDGADERKLRGFEMYQGIMDWAGK